MLVEQDQLGSELYLLLDGVLAVEVDGEPITELGPGAILGDFTAVLESGRRTCTLRASPRCGGDRAADQIDTEHLRELSEGHRRAKEKPMRTL